MPKKRTTIGGVDELDVVLCGALGKDARDGRDAYEQLSKAGFNVLAPRREDIWTFTKRGKRIRDRQLQAISQARLVWLNAPDGKIDPQTAMEVGYAIASGVLVFSSIEVVEVAFRGCITVVASIKDLARMIRACEVLPPAPAVKVFQNYCRKASVHREPEEQTAEEGLLAMAEGFGNLSRAIRKQEGLARHGTTIEDSAPLELAELFIATVRMANILGLDLGKAVQEKEGINIEKLL